ncbi:MAG: hypothetical protein UV04_C0039G0005 [Candidatus Gottesmanbacteria bacterium GW2011_GWA2_42_16]|nr:MAG: hypothetical protein UV04_C0039G0005 [Candidatus Gottesmanbacteria bacterium GW2011_GWA2_42_16]
MVKKIFIVVLIACAVGVAFVVRSRLNSPMQTVTIGSTTIAVEVADTEALRNQGLSGRSDLPGGTGMLFVFDTDGLWSFWMKDMLVGIAHSVSPDTYPQSFTPGEPARYALEVPAGFAKEHGIAEGDVLVRQ